MTDTHLTAPTRFVEIDGDRFAHRRWGNNTTDQPLLLFLQHFRGGLDHWDPLMYCELSRVMRHRDVDKPLIALHIIGTIGDRGAQSQVWVITR